MELVDTLFRVCVVLLMVFAFVILYAIAKGKLGIFENENKKVNKENDSKNRY